MATTERFPFIEAAFGRMASHVPVWMMRQAGRYMPSYQAIKANHSFIEMVETPELAKQITLQPIDEFGMDAAILFSDILVTASAMGCRFDYVEGRGPLFRDPIRHLDQIRHLNESAVDRLRFVTDAIHLLLPELLNRHVPLIGFAGAPFTVAAFMIAGKSPNPIAEVKSWMTDNPSATDLLLNKLATITAAYLNAQIVAGVHAIQIFDTLLDQLSVQEFEKWAWPYLKRVVDQISKPDTVPVIVFSKGTSRFWRYLATLPIQVIGVDSATNMAQLATQLPQGIALQGNLDPQIVVTPPFNLKEQVDRMLKEMSGNPGYIFNLGHGVLKETNPQTVKQIVEWVHAFR